MTQLLRRAGAVLGMLFLSSTLFGLDISINGSPARRELLAQIPWEAAELRLPGDGGQRRGYVLGAVAPLFTSAYRMEITSAEGSHRLEDSRLGDLLFEALLVPVERGGNGQRRIDLYLDGRHYPGVREIDIYGEPLRDGAATLWLSWEGVERLRGELARFAAYHGLELAVERIPDTQSKLTATLRGGGELPDLVMVQASSVAELTEHRALQSLDYLDLSYAGEKGAGAFRLAGSAWAAPLYSDVQMLFVNPHLVPRAARDAAASWSFRQFEAQARRVRQREEAVTPAAWNAYSAYWLSPFLYAFGKERLVEADGGLRIDDAATRRAVDYLLGLRDAGLLRVTERSAMVSDFAAGRVAMILTGSYSIPHFRRLEIPFRPLPFPVNEATGRAAAPFIDYKGLAITRRSRAPVLSRRLLQFLIAEGVQQRFCAALHKLPARTSSRTAVAEELAYFDALQRSYRQGVTVPGERAYGIYKNTMWKLLRFVFSGKMSTEEVLATGQRIIDTTLEQARSLREETE